MGCLQVVGRWTTRDAHLRDYLKKVWVISKEFDSLFMEFIPKEHNFHADRIANAAIDKELQIQEVVSNYFDRSNGAWQGSSCAQSKEPAPGVSSPPARILTPGFSNLKLRPVSPIREAHSTITGSSKPLKSAVRIISQPRIIPVTVSDDVHTSDSDLTRTIKSFTSTKAADKFWADRLSISDEATTSSTASDEEEDAEPGYFKASSLTTGLENHHANPAASVRASGDDSGDDACAEELPEFCKTHLAVNKVEHPAQPGGSHSTLQLSEADCDRLVEAVIEVEEIQRGESQ